MTVENVLLVTIDSLRADRVNARGDVMPGTSALMDRGVDLTAFERAYATGPGTTPSFPALITGTLPLSFEGLGPLCDSRPSVPGRLRKAGLSTAGFHCNPFLSRHFRYDVGFDAFRDYQNPLMGLATRIFPRGIEISNPKLRWLDYRLHLTDALKTAYRLVSGKPRPYVSADIIADDTISWLTAVDPPFFCWMHFMDVHHPCHPPTRYRARYGVEAVSAATVSELYAKMLREPERLSPGDVETLKSLYDAAIEYVDDQIERIVAVLARCGHLEDTLVVLTSDHGELFGDHGEFGKPERMYEALLKVPLVVGNNPPSLGAAAGDLVSLLDVPPLIHDVLGMAVPEAYEGRLPGIDPSRTHVLAEHAVNGDVIVAGRGERWRFEYDELRDETRLYDLEGGSEREVYLDDHHQEAGHVQSAVRSRLSELAVEEGEGTVTVPETVKSRLEDLGYT
jgi:arylsulfatase A-like enzyme